VSDITATDWRTLPHDPFDGRLSISDEDLDLLLLIRNFEQSLLDLFAQGKLNGTTHSCIGQEYIPVAVGALLDHDDLVFSNHRGHGHYLALFNDPAGLLAEVMGRAGAVCNGVGGSQHIHRRGYLSTGVQGESMPVGAGAALHCKGAGKGSLAAVFIGDGTFGEGAVYETLNMAQLWQLPLLVIVENNHIAQSTPSRANMSGTVAGRAAAFGIAHRTLVTTDISAIRSELAPLIHEVRERPMPAVVEFDTVRLGPHSKGDDTRDEAERREAQARDWYRAYAAALGDRFERADTRQRARVTEMIRDVEARALVGQDA
jgi:acetoin:2,6-dichlorophenolindophenol oxidoreductase subunit alpha